MKTVLVTGANGQLGQCIKATQQLDSEIEFVYTDTDDLDITRPDEVSAFFKKYKFDWCINCAAYTAVDKAESDKLLATEINVNGVKHLADSCKTHHVKMIHISTDFVFDGNNSQPYTEDIPTNPLGVYGVTKRDGELVLQETLFEHFIIRTSWLYSEFNANFMKTMLRLASERSELNVVADQIGTPTYAQDLAHVLIEIIRSDSESYGTYHYSNEGVASWYDFAHAIFDENGSDIIVNPINTADYPTPAARPHYSVLDKKKIKDTFGFNIQHWRDSLKVAIHQLNNISE